MDQIERQLYADNEIDNLGTIETTSGMEMQKEIAGVLRVTRMSYARKASKHFNIQFGNSVSYALATYYKLSSLSQCTLMEVEHLSHALHASTIAWLN